MVEAIEQGEQVDTGTRLERLSEKIIKQLEVTGQDNVKYIN